MSFSLHVSIPICIFIKLPCIGTNCKSVLTLHILIFISFHVQIQTGDIVIGLDIDMKVLPLCIFISVPSMMYTA